MMPFASSLAPPVKAPERRILAVVLPELLNELALQRIPPAAAGAAEAGARPVELTVGALDAGAKPQSRARDATRSGTSSAPRGVIAPREMKAVRAVPRAVILTDLEHRLLEPNMRLDAVNSAARRLGVTPRQTIAQATSIVEQLKLQTLPLSHVSAALRQIAEAALGFGSPVSFEAPDTVWVDISGSIHLFGSEHELAQALVAHVRALGYGARVAIASGPWLARAFARHADFDETGIFLVDSARARQWVGLLPISALPISSDSVAWFSRLGLLSLDDLRELPRAALAARLEAAHVDKILSLLEARDDAVLDAYHVEELPAEELSWDCPLESIEPLLFVLKGLAARLSSRLEGRGQAAQELLLTIQYDRAIAALRSRERNRERHDADQGASVDFVKAISFQFASPLAHADDLERIIRSRLQKETLLAPANGLRLQVTAITAARQWQQDLNAGMGLGNLTEDPHAMTVLVAELSADIGRGAVGRLEAQDSHLLEKSSCFSPIQHLKARERPHTLAGRRAASDVVAAWPAEALPSEGPSVMKMPTRLISPVEFNAPLRPKEVVVLGHRAFVIESICFEQRLDAVEWWASAPVCRDYFRLWLAALAGRDVDRGGARLESARGEGAGVEGIEVLVYLNREDGKRYVQALYD